MMIEKDIELNETIVFWKEIQMHTCKSKKKVPKSHRIVSLFFANTPRVVINHYSKHHNIYVAMFIIIICTLLCVMWICCLWIHFSPNVLILHTVVIVFEGFIKNVNYVIGEGCCMSVCLACVGTSQCSEKHFCHMPRHKQWLHTSQPTLLVLYLES
jgi:hypothetical protein